MQEVVSVSAVNENRGRVSGIGYGNAVELAAYTDMLGTGEFTSQTRTLQLSSAAVTAMSGIAALVWTQYPNETNHQIRERLQQAAHAYPQRNTTYGFGVVNATKAVGGMYNAWASRSLVSGGGFSEPATYDLTAHWSGGDGPFQFYWGTGHTTRTIRVTINPGDNPQTYSVWTTDSSDGTQRMASIAVDPPPGGCADPTVIIC